MVLNCFVGIKTESVHAREEILRESRNRTSARQSCVIPAPMCEGPCPVSPCEFERLCLATTVDGHTITPLIVGTMQGGLVYFYFLSVD